MQVIGAAGTSIILILLFAHRLLRTYTKRKQSHTANFKKKLKRLQNCYYGIQCS